MKRIASNTRFTRFLHQNKKLGQIFATKCYSHDLSSSEKKDLRYIHDNIEQLVCQLETLHHKKRSEMVFTCGMSGGIDSSVSALLLQEAGLNVRGLFMSNWDARGEESVDPQGLCESVRLDWQDVKSVCAQFKIPHFHETLANDSNNPRPVRFVETYWNHVFQRMITGYEKGLTPNPDLLCNRHVKFDALLKYIDERKSSSDQIDIAVTGHYAQLKLYNNELFLVRGRDQVKDQTYFLAQVNSNVFKRCMFPLGAFLKQPHVRDLLAKKYYKIPERIYTKKESMGICFVGKRKKFIDFLSDYIDERPGPVISITKDVSHIIKPNKSQLKYLEKFGFKLSDIDQLRIIGEHRGTAFYTIGQSLRLSGMEERVYVCEKDHENNIIYVVGASKHKEYLDEKSFPTCDTHWLVQDTSKFVNNANITRTFTKIKHGTTLIECKLEQTEDGLLTVHAVDNNFFGVAPGQAAVFYEQVDHMEDMICLGSAIIDHKK